MDEHYHTDKNGVSLKYLRGYCIKDSNGEIFELLGTGLKVPGDYGRVSLWTVDNKMTSRDTSEIEVVFSAPEKFWLAAVSVAACIFFAIIAFRLLTP